MGTKQIIVNLVNERLNGFITNNKKIFSDYEDSKIKEELDRIIKNTQPKLSKFGEHSDSGTDDDYDSEDEDEDIRDAIISLFAEISKDVKLPILKKDDPFFILYLVGFLLLYGHQINNNNITNMKTIRETFNTEFKEIINKPIRNKLDQEYIHILFETEHNGKTIDIDLNLQFPVEIRNIFNTNWDAATKYFHKKSDVVTDKDTIGKAREVYLKKLLLSSKPWVKKIKDNSFNDKDHKTLNDLTYNAIARSETKKPDVAFVRRVVKSLVDINNHGGLVKEAVRLQIPTDIIKNILNPDHRFGKRKSKKKTKSRKKSVSRKR